MNEFLKATFTRQKFQGLAVNTALGNFAGYVAGSLVTVISTYHSVERRALRNLFGILPRKKIVVHLLPEWLEWVLALLVGFLVMEFVRHSINHRKYAAFIGTLRHEQETRDGAKHESATGEGSPEGSLEGGRAVPASGGSGQNPLGPDL
jgi:hypothetical protein